MHNGTRILVLSIAQALAASAAAQDDGADAAEGTTAQLAEVVVVGSRIRRVDIETSQPVFVLEREQLLRTGLASVGDIIQDLTIHGAALNTTVNNGGDGSTRVDLRNLGDGRTLVLVNGRRWSTSLDGGVDLNSIPLAIIERIEVLKDGASAIYGSDAIAGVVNLTTREAYDGLEANAYLGESAEGDGRVETYDFTLGASGERGSVALNASHMTQAPIYAGDREISAVPTYGIPADNVFAGASATTPFGRFGFGARGICPFDPAGNYPENGACPRPPGYPNPGFYRSTYDPGTGGYRVFEPTSDGYNFAPENYLQTPQERTALYAQGRYDLASRVVFSFDALYNERRSAQELAPLPFQVGINGLGVNRIVVPASHVYNPFGQDVTGLALRPGGALRRFEQDADTFRFSGGFDGNFELGGRSLAWDLDYVYTDYEIGQTADGLIDPEHLRIALGPSFLGADGVARCGTVQAPVSDCVPLDPFRGPGAITEAMLDYVYYTAQDTVESTRWNYTANLTGDLVDLPAGPLAFAAGYEYRRESGEALQDAFRTAVDNLDDNSFSGRTSVDEAYLEFSVPLLSDRLMAQVLELSLAGRYSDYESFGDTTNYKAGLRWKPIDALMLRGSWSQGFRAPTVQDLFFPNSPAVVDVEADPCNEIRNPMPAVQANCAADGVPGGVYAPENQSFLVLTGGNAELQPETSTSRTLGLVWNPPWAPGLDLLLDWYDIEIEDAIATPVDLQILESCAFEGVAESCARTSRDPVTGDLLRVDSRILNSGTLSTEGYDFTLRYRLDTGYGRFSLVWDSTYVAEYRFEVPRGAGERSAVGNNFTFEPGFRIRSNLDLAWERGDFGAALGLRYYSPLDEACFGPGNVAFFNGNPEYLALCSSPDVASPTHFGYPENRLGSRTYADVQGHWNTPWNGRITLGVQNVGDRDPPVSYAAFANSFDPAYPIPGRFWYASYSQKF